MVKVLFVNTVFGKGSTGRIIKELGGAVERKGGKYRVAFGRGSMDDPHGYKIGNELDRHMHAFLSRLTDRSGFYSKRATRKLIKYIEAYNPDIIHLHNLHGYYINLPLLFAYLKQSFKGRIVWTLHDCWAFTGHCSHFTKNGCCKWETECYQCPQRNDYPKSWLVDSSTRNYRDKKSLFCGLENLVIVTVSEWLKRMAEKSFLGGYPIIRIYNGIDTSVFRPMESDVRIRLGLVNKKIILSVADGFDERKGLDRILETAAVAPNDWVFLIVGIDKAKIKSFPERVIGLERVDNPQELIKIYSAANVFFNPSLEETFGLVTLEAMACGTSAVVMNSTACPELIVSDSCGTVLPCKVSAEKTVSVLAAAMQKQGARLAAFDFSLEKQCENYLRLFE